MQAAIAARKQELAMEQQQLQAALDAGVASGIDPLDQPNIQPDIKVRFEIMHRCRCLSTPQLQHSDGIS
jgi:hypothetical protein